MLERFEVIHHNQPTFGSEEVEAAKKVLAGGWVAQGSEVGGLEAELCAFFNLPPGHSLVVSSGSAALYLALFALGGKDKLIGLPVYACAALRNAVGLIGGRAYYIDNTPESPNINTADLEGVKLDILIAPSMFGIPIELPNHTNYKVIEDIAQSLGASASGKRIGLRGEIGICSFYATKMITCGGQGGAIVSKDKAVIDKLRDYREFDCREDSKLRFNFQMTDLQAAIGRVQLRKLPSFLKQRELIFEVYRSSGLNLMETTSHEDCSSYYRAIMRASNPLKIISTLASENIRAIIPVEERELLDDKVKYPVAYHLTKTTVSLPIYPNLSLDNAKKIAEIIKGAI
jgi:perosamine synthetase